jgi:uncharacterized protein (TIGR00255 family)
MIRSMTGYGTASETFRGGRLTVEARSVNSRHLRLVVKGPPGSEAWEPSLRTVVEGCAKRGRVELSFAVDEGTAPGYRHMLDEERVRELLTGFQELQEKFDVPGTPDIATLVQAGGLFHESNGDPEAISFEDVRDVTARALDGLIEMREQEGARLEADLQARVAALRAGIVRVEELAPQRLERERERLRQAVAEIAEARDLEDDRLAREIALIADRWEISEELVRTRSHLDAFEEYLRTPADEPVGKRLGFLVQELQREVNTLGAKANDIEISRCAVEMKNEIEKLREQVENVE